MIPRSMLRKIQKNRPAWSHKGQNGRLLVVGGSIEYTGSPIFNALAAYRSGCDIVKICAPEKAALSIRSYSPDMIAYPLRGDYLRKKHIEKILNLQKTNDAMVIGGGLGKNKDTLRAVTIILKKTNIPAVVDADALYAIDFRLSKNFVLTPHTKEFEQLAGSNVSNSIGERKKAAQKLASDLSCVVLLKGHVDVITDGKKTETNSTGCPEMAKAGTGDILAGICGALLAKHLNAFDAACLAAYINGKAGQLAAKKHGQGLKASDVVEEIPNVMRPA